MISTQAHYFVLPDGAGNAEIFFLCSIIYTKEIKGRIILFLLLPFCAVFVPASGLFREQEESNSNDRRKSIFFFRKYQQIGNRMRKK
jgi:hypothetical protein